MDKLTPQQKHRIINTVSKLITSGKYKKIQGARRNCNNGRCYLGLIQEAVIELGYGEWDLRAGSEVRCKEDTPQAIKALVSNALIYNASPLGLNTKGIDSLNDRTDKSLEELHKIFVEENQGL